MDTSVVRERLQGALGARYRVEREIGGGGMSHVFVAEDVESHGRIVVKVLSPELAGTVDGDRFRREIQILTMLHNPGIVPVLGTGPVGPMLYYMMPLIEGDTLRMVLHRERQLPLETALRYATNIADALAFAHEHNVVHRDIKPDNILIQGDRAVVTDFGISRAIERSADIESLTATGFTLGTPRYMSPEQAAAAKHIDGRSDIYSLACVLFEMLAGEAPFPGTNARLIIAQHLRSAPPSVRASRADVPRYIDAALLRALAKDPADRYETIHAFAEAIRPDATRAAGDETGPPRWAAAARAGGWRHQQPVIYGALAAVVVAVVIAVARCAP
jgi:serine/threonine-protein kinase